MIYLGIIVGIVLLERGIKGFIEANKELGEESYYCKDAIIVEKYHNKGVALNFLQKHVGIVKTVTGAMIGSLLIILGLLLGKKDKKLLKTGLALLLGGALSNWIDRLEKGYVVDYFRINKGKRLKNIVFNLADMFVFFGGVLVLLAEFISGED